MVRLLHTLFSSSRMRCTKGSRYASVFPLPAGQRKVDPHKQQARPRAWQSGRGHDVRELGADALLHALRQRQQVRQRLPALEGHPSGE